MWQLFLIDRWSSGWVVVRRMKRNVLQWGGGANICHPPARPTPSLGLAHQVSFHHVPHLWGLCSLHDIKAIWTYVEQSPGLSGGHHFECSLCWGQRGRKALCYWMGLVSIIAQPGEKSHFHKLSCFLLLLWAPLMIQCNSPCCSSSMPTMTGIACPDNTVHSSNVSYSPVTLCFRLWRLCCSDCQTAERLREFPAHNSLPQGTVQKAEERARPAKKNQNSSERGGLVGMESVQPGSDLSL